MKGCCRFQNGRNDASLEDNTDGVGCGDLVCGYGGPMANRWAHDACAAVGVDAWARSRRGPGVPTRIATTDWAATHRVRQPTSGANARVACLRLRLCSYADVGQRLQRSCGTTSGAWGRRSCTMGEPCPSGKPGVVTFKPHRFSGIGSDRASVP
jgi:hypothetical protein